MASFAEFTLTSPASLNFHTVATLTFELPVFVDLPSAAT
jgi:hypothetical protein